MTRQKGDPAPVKPGPVCHPIVIASLNNPAVKRIRRLRLRREREETGLFFVEGIRMVLAAWEQGAEIETLITVPEQLETAQAGHDLARLLRQEMPFLQVERKVLQFLADREDTQGIGAVIRQRWEPLDCVKPAQGAGWVALDGIQYPGNLGTILRVCDAVGGRGVILIGNTADPFDPISLRASMGAVFYQQLVRCSFEAFAAWKMRCGVTLIGTSPEAPVHYRQIGYEGSTVLCLGCEGKGLSRERLALCDTVVSIPMAGRCDSLNVAMAASVLLYERYHQTGSR